MQIVLVKKTYLSTDLVTALTGLNVNNFSHFSKVVFFSDLNRLNVEMDYLLNDVGQQRQINWQKLANQIKTRITR